VSGAEIAASSKSSYSLHPWYRLQCVRDTTFVRFTAVNVLYRLAWLREHTLALALCRYPCSVPRIAGASSSGGAVTTARLGICDGVGLVRDRLPAGLKQT
jgi:hypothetical protein